MTDGKIAGLVIRGQGPRIRSGLELFQVSFAAPTQFNTIELSRAALDRTIEMLTKLRDGQKFIEPVVCDQHPAEAVDQDRAASAHYGSMMNPGVFDCLAKLDPGEPHFTLLGRDPAGPRTILFWAEERHGLIQAGALTDSPHEREKTAEAQKLAASFEAYQRAQNGATENLG